jgi:hypothetical protein
MNPDPRETLLTILAMAVFFALLVGAMVWWEKRKALGRAASFAKQKGGPPPEPPLIRRTLILVLVGLIAAFWLYVPKHPGHGPPKGPPPRGSLTQALIVLFGVPPALVLGWIGFILYRALRHSDRAMKRAIMKANAGDTDGALADIRAEIAAKGLNAARANALSAVHYLREEWDEATAMIEETERLGYKKENCQLALALIRYRLGHPEEALSLLKAVYGKEPNDSALGCSVCDVLRALGRYDEARNILADVERRRKDTIYLGSSRSAVDQMIRDCRERLEGKPKKTSLSEFDEL